MEKSEIDTILQGRQVLYGYEIVAHVKRLAQEFVNDLFGTLRERRIDLRSSKVVFVGGGSIMLRQQIEKSDKAETMLFVENINANTKGYEFLYKLETSGR